MKILHCCLSNFYVDDFNYQENLLVREHIAAGHEVLVLASTEIIDSDGKLVYLLPCRYFGTDGAEVIRIRYKKIYPKFLARKIRAYHAAYQNIDRFKPDVIMFHGTCAWELLTLSMYKQSHPDVKLYLDSHEDFNNSARSFLSRIILYRLFYSLIIRKSLPHIEKILCVSIESIDFMDRFIGCPKSKLEYYPLGGVIFNDNEYSDIRSLTRKKLGIPSDSLVFFQSGKFDVKKKLIDALTAFQSISSTVQINYIVAGALQEDIRAEAQSLFLSDPRTHFLGWMNRDELMQTLCAADVYVQPGSQSATLQNSICCRCAVIADDVSSHYPFVEGNGWLVRDIDSLIKTFNSAINAFQLGHLDQMKVISLFIARHLLDYQKLASRLTSNS